MQTANLDHDTIAPLPAIRVARALAKMPQPVMQAWEVLICSRWFLIAVISLRDPHH